MYRLALTTAIFCTMLLPFAPATAHARGEFSRTCSNIEYDSYHLFAYCKTANGSTNRTFIDLSNLLYWKKRPDCTAGTNCHDLAWGPPTGKGYYYFKPLSYYQNEKKVEDEAKYWLSGTGSPLYLYGKVCGHLATGLIGPIPFCSESSIDLDEHIKNNNGTLEYVP